MSLERERKALLVPYNPKGEILIQDRAGYKPPPWGFFGGSIDGTETPMAAVIREAKEELGLDLMETNLISLGNQPTTILGNYYDRHFFLYFTNQREFTVLEGSGCKWVSFKEAAQYLSDADKIEALEQSIVKLQSNT